MRRAGHFSRRVSGDSELHTSFRSVHPPFRSCVSQKLNEPTVADNAAFKEVLIMGQEINDDAAHRKWVTFGSRFLHITSKYYAMNKR